MRSVEEALDIFENDGYKAVVSRNYPFPVVLPSCIHRYQKYVVLSGGLGSSAYVFRHLEDHFKTQGSARPCTDGTRVQMCADPQLVVVKGLLLDRKNSILRTRIARASYGVVVEQRYSKKVHFGQLVRLDPFDKKKYVTDQIHWLVKKGDKITTDKTFSLTIERRALIEDRRMWTEKVVTSENGQTWLSNNMTEREYSPTQVNLSNSSTY